MNTTNLFIAVIPILLIAYFIIQHYKKLEAEKLEKERKERLSLELAEAKRVKEKAILKGMYQDILLANRNFGKFISFKEGYFNNNKLTIWKALVGSLYHDLSKYKIEKLKLDNTIVLEIKQLKINYDTGETLRKTYNKNFIEKELNECYSFFSNIEGQSLDEQQRLAIIKDEDNNLVIAGAGSGKTTTVAGKVAYVIDCFNVKPEEILLITFTKKASDEMKHRNSKSAKFPGLFRNNPQNSVTLLKCHDSFHFSFLKKSSKIFSIPPIDCGLLPYLHEYQITSIFAII